MKPSSTIVRFLRRLRAYAPWRMCGDAAHCGRDLSMGPILQSDLDRKKYRIVKSTKYSDDTLFVRRLRGFVLKKLENGVEVLLVEDSNRREDEACVGVQEGQQSAASKGKDANTKKNEWLAPGIADEDEEYEPTCACAAVLKMGSFSDPPELQGAAHFIEHMLFMGNAKFKKEGEIDTFLDRHGGSSNAFTEHQFICLHLDVDEEALAGALERFAHLFISPRFTEDALHREVHAVDNEFAGMLSSDVQRLDRLQSLSTPLQHPAHNFSWGNKKSLWTEPRKAGLNVKQVLTDHCMDYCGAQNLLVVVRGTQTLNKLEKMVKNTFGKVPRAPKDAPDYSHMGLPFKESTMAVCPAVSNAARLMVTWQLSRDDRGRPEHQTAAYIAALLGAQAQGSLRAALRRRGWASAVQAHCAGDGFSDNDSYSLFQIALSLTPEGLHACFNTAAKGAAAITLEPLTLLFQNIVALQSAGPPEHVWEELRIASEMMFRFGPEVDDLSEWVAETAESAARNSFQNCLIAPFKFGDFDLEHHSKVLQLLLPGAGSCIRVDLQLPQHSMHTTSHLKDLLQVQHDAPMNYAVAAHLVRSLEHSNESHDDRFGFPYAVARIPEELLSKWARPPPSPPNLFLVPPPNPYIPQFTEKSESTTDESSSTITLRHSLVVQDTVFQVKDWWGSSLKHPRLLFPSVSSRHCTAPQLLLDECGMRIWHLPCVYQHAPMVEIRIRIASPAFVNFPPRVTHAFFAAWCDACAAVAADAETAGLTLSFSNAGSDDIVDLCTVEGVTLTVAGFSGSTQQLAADVFKCLSKMCHRIAAMQKTRNRSLELSAPNTAAVSAAEDIPSVAPFVGLPLAVSHLSSNVPDFPLDPEDVVEEALIEEFTLRELDCDAMAQLDEIDEFALAVLDQLLCTPSHAVPTLFSAASFENPGRKGKQACTPATPTDSSAPTQSTEIKANGASHGSEGHDRADLQEKEADVAALASAALAGMHCEALIAGNIDSGDSLQLGSQIRLHISSAAAALSPQDINKESVTAQLAGDNAPLIGAPAQPLNGTNGKGNAKGKSRKKGKGGATQKSSGKSADQAVVQTPPCLPAHSRPLQRCVTLREGSSHAFKLRITAHGYENSALAVYFQVGPATPRLKALCELLSSAMSTRAYIFLRTQEQLGYEVDVTPKELCGVCGIVLTVGGGATAAAGSGALVKVEEFLEDFGRTLASMPKSEFRELKDAAIADLGGAVSDLEADVDSVWEYISKRSYAFSEHTRIQRAMESLVPKDLKKFFHQYVAPDIGGLKTMRSRVILQVLVGGMSSSQGTPHVQSSGSGIDEGSGSSCARFAEEADELGAEASSMGKGRHVGQGQHSWCMGGGRRARSARSGHVEMQASLWCCSDTQVKPAVIFEEESGMSETEVHLTQGAERIIDVEQWKATQSVFPRTVGPLPR